MRSAVRALPLLASAISVATLLSLGCASSVDGDPDAPPASAASAAAARCAPGEVDLAAYVLPRCDGPSAPNKGIDGDLLRTFPTASTDGRAHFVVLKSKDGEGLEEWSVDREWLRIYKDTTWAFNPDKQGRLWCDVQCSATNELDGQCKMRWRGDDGAWAYTVYRDEDGAPGAKWLPRCVKPGKEYTTRFVVSAGDARSCASCDTNLSGAGAHTVRISRAAEWNGRFDVVTVEVILGVGQGESYSYGRGLGWVGFHGRPHAEGLHDAASVVPRHACQAYAPADICARM